MLVRVLLFSALLIFGLRLFFPQQWREFGRRFDRAINVSLVLLVVLYAAQLLWMWLSPGH